MARIAIIDDHLIVLEGVAALLARAGHEVALATADPEALRRAVGEGGMGLAVLDLTMPGAGGLQLAVELRRLDPRLRLVLLTSNIGPLDVAAAMGQGVEGIVLKESAPAQLTGCIDAVLSGQRWYDPEITRRAFTGSDDAPAGGEPLSPREAEVVELVVSGHRNKEIADRLGVTEGTVKTHLHNIYAKLGVTSRTQLAYVARRGG